MKNKKQRFSIRKYSFGAASVLLGAIAFAVVQPQVVQAEEAESTVFSDFEEDDDEGVDVASILSTSMVSVSATAGADVSDQATVGGATISGDVNNGNNMSLTISINTPVNSGDYVELYVHNVPTHNLRNFDVKDASGNVLGIIQREAQTTPREVTRDQPVDDSVVAFGDLSTLRVVFNDYAANQANLSFSIELKNQGQDTTVMSEPTQIQSYIEVAGVKYGEITRTIPKRATKTNATTNLALRSEMVVHDNELTEGRANVYLYVSEDKPVVAGTEFTLTLGEGNKIAFLPDKIIGKKGKMTYVDTVTPTTPKNINNVYFFQSMNPSYTIVAADEKSVTVRVNEDVPGVNDFYIPLGDVLTLIDEADPNLGRVYSGKATSTSSTGESVETDVNLDFRATGINASSGPALKSFIRINFLEDGTEETLQSPYIQFEKVGNNYDVASEIPETITTADGKTYYLNIKRTDNGIDAPTAGTYVKGGSVINAYYVLPTVTTESKTVTRTIKYQYEDGTPVEADKAPTVTQVVTYGRTKTETPKGTTLTSWTSSDPVWAEVVSPELDSYTVDIETVEEFETDSTTEDVEVIVTYKRRPRPIVVIPPQPNKPNRPTPEKPETPGNNTPEKPGQPVETPDGSTKKVTPKGQLPNTGEASSAAGLLGTAILGLVGLGYAPRRKRK